MQRIKFNWQALDAFLMVYTLLLLSGIAMWHTGLDRFGFGLFFLVSMAQSIYYVTLHPWEVGKRNQHLLELLSMLCAAGGSFALLLQQIELGILGLLVALGLVIVNKVLHPKS